MLFGESLAVVADYVVMRLALLVIFRVRSIMSVISALVFPMSGMGVGYEEFHHRSRVSIVVGQLR